VTRLLAAELFKLRSTRMPYVFAAVVMLLSAIAAAGYVGTDSLDEDPWLSLARAVGLSNIVATILGILIVTTEYRHGTINATFLVEPARELVLAVKLVAGLLAGTVLAVFAALAALAVALPWLAARGDSLPVDVGIVEAGGRLVAVFVLACGLGIGIGAIIQNQVGAIVATFVWFFVGESIVGVISSLLTDGIGEPDPVSPYLPGSVLQAVIGFEQGEAFLLGGPWAVLLTSVYVAGLAVLGGLSMLRRDP
jgi:hypothetical protein